MDTTTAPLVSLVKDQKVDLTKGNPGLNNVTVGGGWDVNGGNSGSYDLDLLAFFLKANADTAKYPHGQLVHGAAGIAYFGNKKIAGCELDKDNLTGEGAGDDERIFVDLSAIPADVDAVMFGVNIYQAKQKAQSFGMVQNAFMRIYDTAAPQKEHIRYDLTEDYSGNTAILFGKLYRHNGEWKFQAIGQGVNGDINEVVAPFN